MRLMSIIGWVGKLCVQKSEEKATKIGSNNFDWLSVESARKFALQIRLISIIAWVGSSNIVNLQNNEAKKYKKQEEKVQKSEEKSTKV